MTELIEQLNAAMDLVERHADKDLALAAECSTPPSTWEAWYGHHLPYSEIRIGEGEPAEIVLSGSRHDSDAMLVSRAVRSIEERAKAAKVQVAAHRKILDIHSGSHECASVEDNCVWIDGISGSVCETVLALAEAYGIEVAA